MMKWKQQGYSTHLAVATHSKKVQVRLSASSKTFLTHVDAYPLPFSFSKAYKTRYSARALKISSEMGIMRTFGKMVT